MRRRDRARPRVPWAAAACLATAALAAQPAAAQPGEEGCAPGLALALRGPGRAACVWEGTAAALGWEVLRGPSPPEPSGCGRYRDLGGPPAAVNCLAAAVHPALGGGGNSVFSPAGLYLASAALLAGADGRTAERLAEAAGLERDAGARVEETAAFYASLYRSAGAADLDLEQALWIPGARPAGLDPELARIPGARPLPGYYAAMQRSDFWGAKTVDFGHPDAAGWISRLVEGDTRGVVRGIVSPGDLAGGGLVVTSAAYAGGDWAHPFSAPHTFTGDFRAAGGGVKTEFLSLFGPLAPADAGDAEVVLLPYDGSGLHMILVLPHERYGLAGLEAALSPEAIDRWAAAALSPEAIDRWAAAAAPFGGKGLILLPKFRASQSHDLEGPLARLGAAGAFAGAGLAGITGGDLRVGRAVQESYVELAEGGGNEARALSLVLPPPEYPMIHLPPPPHIKFDRPFLFMVRDGGTGAVLLIGRVADPRPCGPPPGAGCPALYEDFGGVYHNYEGGPGATAGPWRPEVHWSMQGWRLAAAPEGQQAPGAPRTNKVALAEGCRAPCSMGPGLPVDLSSYGPAELSLSRFLGPGLGDGGYLRVELHGGSSWEEILGWRASEGDADGAWHEESHELSPRHLVDGLRMRITAGGSGGPGAVMVDDVAVYPSGAPAPAP